MESFFTKKETESISRPTGKSNSCFACGLFKECNTPRMEPYGNFKKRILNIGEAPGEVEDKSGKPWQGKVGKLLQSTYEKLGVDLFDDCLNINAVMCRPTTKDGHNRNPSNSEVECCRRRVLQVIDEYKPRLIIILGNAGLSSLVGHRWKKDLGGITKWRGFTIPDQDFKAWICPTFHPSYIERSYDLKGKSVEDVIWKQDLKQALSLLDRTKYQGKSFPTHPFRLNKEPVIDIIEDLSPLNEINNTRIAFDFETTGLKPHAAGQRIVCCSVATSEDHVYVFPIPDTKKGRQPLVDLLANKTVTKVAANMKFEDTWSKVRLGVDVVGWEWDTMIMAHVLDNRQGVTGLKFQVYVNFGVVDYSSEISPYLEATDNKNGNGLNRIIELMAKPGGAAKVLKYCAYDSIYEYRLAKKQEMDLLPF